ncbi:phage tail protein [Leucobacter massiliensis]|uniref:Phage tail protein n=1 Tax=Leucobacter massiliensis TaxID=1686285 RepID=A0A2S9QR17_9MICO|nr:phage tail protein [Leucobacter massiliensis]PRI12034.1 phage tail protein [Leucobacter massiliensis]
MHTVSFRDVSTAGLEESPAADALAGLRANEARYFHTKFGVDYAVCTPDERPEIVEWVLRVLREERGIEPASRVLEVFAYDSDELFWPALYFADGLAVNVLWEKAPGGKRAVGFKLSSGMEPPAELAAFKWARQRSKLAGEIRGSYFVVKGDHPLPLR